MAAADPSQVNLGDETSQILSKHIPEQREVKSWEVQKAFYLKSDAHSRKILVRSWFPKGVDKPKAIVFIIHGVNEHIGCYVELAHRLTENGFGVFGHDHLGHGASEGFKGDIEDFEYLVSDAKQVVRSQSATYPGLPLFIIGHSMGSLITFHTSFEIEKETPGIINGVLFSGFAGVPGPSAASLFGIKCLFCLTESEFIAKNVGGCMAWLAPRGNLAPVILADTTHVKEVIATMKVDPYYNLGQILNRTGSQVLKCSKKYRARVSEYTLPFLALHGGDDTITYPLGSQQLFDHAASSEKDLKIYPGLYHVIFLETSKDAVVKDVIDYFNATLDKRAKKAAAGGNTIITTAGGK